MKKLQNMYQKSLETKYTYVLMRVNNNSSKIQENMDTNTHRD